MMYVCPTLKLEAKTCYSNSVDVFAALKIQCSSSAFYLLEEIGGYVLECRGMLQVKVSFPLPPRFSSVGHWKLPS